MKVSLRRPAPVTTTAAVAEESAKPRQGALGWALGVLLRALVVVAVVLWLWPPRPRDPAPLPVDWTPGCPKLQAEWRALQPQHGVIRHPVPTHVGSDAAIFGVAGGSGARLVRVSAAGSEDVLHGPYGPLREPAAVAGSLWAIEESPGRTGLVEVDPATCRVRRSWHYPPRDEPPLQSRLAPEHRTPLELPDGSLAVVVRVDATKAAWIVVGYNPTTGAFGITRLDEEIKEHTQFATHPPNLLLTRSWRDGPGTKAIDLATGRVVPTPEGVEIPRMVAPYDRRLAVLTKAAPGHGEGALIG
ncbi:MAG TPA: hypothetical protein VEI97_15670, partial [bacterium]|nr:hypothetical protein [bacterium]